MMNDAFASIGMPTSNSSTITMNVNIIGSVVRHCIHSPIVTPTISAVKR